MESSKPAKSAFSDKVARDEAPQLALVRAGLYNLPPVKPPFFANIFSELGAGRWIVLGAMVAGLTAGVVYTMLQTPLYESHAALEVQSESQDQSVNERATVKGAAAKRDESADSSIETQVRILQSRSMLERVLNRLTDVQRQKLVERALLGRNRADLLDTVERRLVIAPSARTHIIDISFLCPNAQVGADFLNLLAQELSDYALERQWKSAQRSGDWLQPQLDEVRSKLEASEKALDEYARGGGVALAGDGSELASQWITARNDRITKQVLYEHLRTAPANKAAEISGDATLKALERQAETLQSQMAAGAANAPMDGQTSAPRAQWRELQHTIELRETTLLEQAREAYQEAAAQERTLRAQLGPKRAAALEKAAQVAPEKTARYALLKQDAAANRQLYDSLTTRITEAGIASSLKTRTIMLLDSAYAANKPVTPNGPLDAAAGLGAGALGGMLFVLLRRVFSPTFSQPGTLSRVLSLPELGSVPEPESRLGMATAVGHTATGAVPFSTSDDSAQSESYRAIRSSLLYQTGDSLLRCLVFTSATAGEGKTTVASNLSMSLAATNRRVLLVDGDMRRPNLHKIFGVSPGPGLSDLLRRDRLLGTAGNAQFIVQTAIPNLYLLPCGTAGGDAPELLAGDRLPQLLKEMRKNFDLVIIDTPPVLPCADARSFAKAADGVILVVRANETDRREAGVARDTLLQDGSPVIGTVLTGFQARRGAYGYNGYSALPK